MIHSDRLPTLLLIEADSFGVDLLARCAALCRDQFGAQVVVTGPSSRLADLSAAVPGVLAWEGAVPSGKFGAVATLCERGTNSRLASGPRLAGVPVYRLDPGKPPYRPRLSRVDGALLYDHADTHVFNRLSAKIPKGYVFQPYGYVYRMTGHGALDAFGFRIDADFAALERRPANHKLVVTFGGSTTWSIDCLPSESYTARLEAKLNAHASKSGGATVFTCLNFGQIAYVTLNEMFAFLLHAWRLRPDVVIAHDGWNDLLYGSYVDPYLVQEEGIVYACDLEPWAQRLHASEELETTKTAQTPYPLRSSPGDVVGAYLFRKNQFRALAETAGAKFVWGLQPNVHDKKQPSADEIELVDHANPLYADDWHHVRKRIPQLCRQVAEACRQVGQPIVDVGAAFADLSADVQHFTDTIHLTPAGDEAVADVYFRHLLDRGIV
jgi:hypothetical protein